MPVINGRYYMNPQYGLALERARAADEGDRRSNGEPEPSWLDHFLGLVPTDEDHERMSRLVYDPNDVFDESSPGAHAGDQAEQNQPAHGEGSQANLDRRTAIAVAAARHEGDTSMPYTPGHATCNLFSARAVAESGAPKPLVKKADGTMGVPSAAEFAGDRIPPGWRILKPGERPQPGDIAARKEHFADATGHSGIVVSAQNGTVTAMAAHQRAIGKDMSFQPRTREEPNHNVFLRYTGE